MTPTRGSGGRFIRQLKIGSLFSGVGGLDLAVEAFFGGKTVWHCEWEAEPSKVLAARWPGVPNFGDVTAVDWSTVEPVDILCGGFPCQDLSLAGRRSGMRPGTRSGLWSDFRKAIAVLRPSVVLIENVRGLLSGCAESESDSELGSCPRCADPESGVQHAPNLRALGRVLIDLAGLGFDAEWHALPASDVGAPHGRFRVFVLAYAHGVRLGSRWDSIAGEETSGRPSAVAGGRADAPLTLLSTPLASSASGVQTLERQVGGRGSDRLLPTPTTAPETGNGHARNLGAEVKLLPTPQAVDGTGSGRHNSPGHADSLPGTVRLLPTPTTAYATGGNAVRGGDRSGEKLLPGIARDVTHGDTVDWGEYGPAVRRWEAITRPAPPPTLPDGKKGNRRLSAAFDEWMMGYPAGWVTEILARNPAIKACGNGVVPQQAYAGLGVLWPRVRLALAA